jgi:HEPN domain-containing protein
MTLSYYTHKVRELLGQAATDVELGETGYADLLDVVNDELDSRYTAIEAGDDDFEDDDRTDLYDETGDVVA